MMSSILRTRETIQGVRTQIAGWWSKSEELIITGPGQCMGDISQRKEQRRKRAGSPVIYIIIGAAAVVVV